MARFFDSKALWLSCVMGAVTPVMSGCSSGPPQPGQEAFEQANGRLAAYQSETGFGDEALARAFSQKAKTIDAELFSGGASKVDDATTQGQWLTYVHRNGRDVVFLVRVPLLKTYEGADRDALMKDVLWEAAREVAGEALDESNVVIAARGAVAYGGIAKGRLDESPHIETAAVVDTSVLYGYFGGDASGAKVPPAK